MSVTYLLKNFLNYTLKSKKRLTFDFLLKVNLFLSNFTYFILRIEIISFFFGINYLIYNSSFLLNQKQKDEESQNEK